MEAESQSCFSPGEILPGHAWEIVSFLGEGGMGEIYEVRDPVLDRHYILKTVRRDLRMDEAVRRSILNEAKTLARVEHQNIVRVFSYGVTNDRFQQPFFLMDRAQGSTLYVICIAVGKMSVRLACEVFHAIALALHHAHERGVIHGDVTPSNIMLGTAEHSLFESGEGREVVRVTIIDWGIARKRNPSPATAKLQEARGTPRYASPEQVRGRRLTPRSDVYSLAIILYEALTRKYPYPDLGEEATEGAFCAAHMGASEVQPLEAHGPFPKRLCALVNSALERDPARRPADALHFAAELQMVLRELDLPSAKAGRRDQTTLRRLLSAFEPEGRDDAAPASQRTRPSRLPLRPRCSVRTTAATRSSSLATT